MRVAIAALLTGVALRSLDGHALAGAVAHASPLPLLAALLLVVADRALMAHRWLVLLCTIPRAARPPLSSIVHIFLVSTFVGTFLPSSVGGDAVRAYALSREDVSAPHAVASVVVDRLLGVLSILLVGIVAVEWSVDLLHGPLLTANLLAAFAICGIALALILAPAPGRSLPVPGWLRSSRALTYLTALRAYQPHPRQLAYVLLLSIAVQVLRVGQAYAAGVALHITQASFLDYLVYVPIIVLLMQLPITINGIGTCQVAFVWFFGQRGVPAPQAFALSVLFLLLGVAGNLPGSVLYAAHGLTRRRLPAPTGI